MFKLKPSAMHKLEFTRAASSVRVMCQTTIVENFSWIIEYKCA